MSIVSIVIGMDGTHVSSQSSLETLLNLLQNWKEKKGEVSDVELQAVQIWALRKACFLNEGETKTLKSENSNVSVSVGKKGKIVYYEDGEVVLEAQVSDLVLSG